MLTSTVAGTVTLPGGGGTIALAANQAATIPAGSSITFSGTGTGTVNLSGPATVTLSGAGTLALASPSASGSGGTITTSSGTTSFTNGGSVSSLAAGSQINVVGSGTIDLTGTTDGSAPVTLPVILPSTSSSSPQFNFTTTGTVLASQGYQVPGSWSGVGQLNQSTGDGRTTVTITQNTPLALLNWTSFNIGKQTTLDFDQSAGGVNVGTWVAMNRILDPTLAPSQILGNIQASGQVYVINQNGIIFGGSSQVNTHALVVSTLPINSNLVANGLLNNPDAQFLFTSMPISFLGATVYNPNTDPDALPNATSGNITVEEGASITSPTTPEHVGGKIALIAPNVDNEGTLSSPDGQIILAAGQQVGLTAHSQSDASLRGLDVAVGAGNGTAENGLNGFIDAPRADVTMEASTILQLGVIDSTTSVSLNGRIDLLAVNNMSPLSNIQDHDFVFAGGNGGTVTLGADSLTEILPEYSSTDTAVGTSLALPSQIYMEGQTFHMESNAQLAAPNATATLSFGILNSAIASASGETETPLQENYSTSSPTLYLSAPGEVYFDPGADLDVSGSSDVAASVAENIVTAQLRGAELENSPLQKDGPLRGQSVQIDITKTGTNPDGSTWIGSPIGDLSGYANLVQHTVGELTAAGGSVSIATTGAVIMQPTSTINVSGGSIDYAGATVQTSEVETTGGQILNISQADPNLSYLGIYTGFTTSSPKWGITQVSTNPVESGAYYETGYVQGASGGSLTIKTPAAALNGSLFGNTTSGAHQQLAPPAPSTLNLTIQGANPNTSPPDINVIFQQAASGQPPVAAFSSSGLPTLSSDVYLSPDLVNKDGFYNLVVNTGNGNITIGSDAVISTPGGGAVNFTGANIDVFGQLYVPDGSIQLTSLPVDPELTLKGVSGSYSPLRGNFTLHSGGVISTAGLSFDEFSGEVGPSILPFDVNGGNNSITINDQKFSIAVNAAVTTLEDGSTVDASGGASRNIAGKVFTGNGGNISLNGSFTGTLPEGQLILDGTLSSYGFSQGGTLALTAPAIQVGGLQKTFPENADPLLLQSGFFSDGGFSSFSLIGVAGVQILDNITPILTKEVLSADQNQFSLSLESSSLLPQYPAAPVNLSFTASGSTTFVGNLTLAADIVTGATSTVSLTGPTVDILGEVVAPGGTVSIAGGSTLALGGSLGAVDVSVHLGPQALIDTSGELITTTTVLDGQDYTTGQVLPGGTINITGNIVGEAGSELKADGAVGQLDVPTSSLVLNPQASTFARSAAYTHETVASNGGSINLKGTEELYFDGDVSARAGNQTALGGTLTVGSNVLPVQPIPPNAGYAELYLKQDGSFLTGQTITLGSPLPGSSDIGGGYFTVAQFANGGFDSLKLNGNVEFMGDISLHANQQITIAPDSTNGTVFADNSANQQINISAPYISIGATTLVFTTGSVSNFAPPYITNNTQTVVAPPVPGMAAPTFGSASLNLTADDLIDVGFLSLQNIGTTSFSVANGDIRGGGLLYAAGTVNLTAGQIYTPTASTFTVAAFDTTTQSGTVNIFPGVSRELPLSAGGTINIYASIINQDGVLRAPFGTINLGALPDSVTGLTPVIAGIQFTLNAETGLFGATPDYTEHASVTQQLTLGPDSITSVSGVDPTTGQALDLPYGTNLNGVQWVDPTGKDITTGGLPVKAINLQGVSVADEKGSVLDLTGGGDLFAYLFNSGLGGTVDILSSSTKSFAVVPGYEAGYAPIDLSVDSTGATPYANSSLKVGSEIYLAGGDGLAAGMYTLLPARYALLPGAFLVTPEGGAPPSQATSNPDGSVQMGGYLSNSLNPNQQIVPTVTNFEVDSAAVIAAQAEYDISSANTFLKASALQNNVAVPRLPVDAGQLVFSATNNLEILGGLSGHGGAGGLGSAVDIGSPDDIYIVPTSTSTPNLTVPTGTDPTDYTYLTVAADELDSFGADSLLIGGIRSSSSAGTVIDPTTNAIYLQNNAATALTGNEIILVSKQTLTLATGSDIAQSGVVSTGAENLIIGSSATSGSGDGSLIRVTGDPDAQFTRLGVNTADTTPNLVINAGASIDGVAVTLDSTSGAFIDPTAALDQVNGGQALVLQSGEIALQVDPQVSLSSASGLAISSATLQAIENSVQRLSLLSYSSFDLYGSGVLGGLDASGQPVIQHLSLTGAGILGFDSNGGTVTINAQNVSINNSVNQTLPTGVPVLPNGAAGNSLVVNADTIQLGANTFSIDGFTNVSLTAANGIMVSGNGGITSQGGLDVATPVVTGATGANYAFTAMSGSLDVVQPTQSGTSAVTGGLGATISFTGPSVNIGSTISAPTGTISVNATTGDVDIQSGGSLNAGGEAVTFGSVTSYTNGGQVNLTSEGGNVILDGGSLVSVAAQTGGG